MTMHEVLEICRESSGDESMDFLDPISALGDSLDMLNVVSSLEVSTGLRISDEQLLAVRTCGELAEWFSK